VKPVIGYFSARSCDETLHLIAAFQRGLADAESQLSDMRQAARVNESADYCSAVPTRIKRSTPHSKQSFNSALLRS
jgi:hypothetical protein